MRRQGMTLMEVIVVLIIVAIAAAYCLPNFTNPTEQARAQTAQNNLLAIYTSMKNYNNNNQSFPGTASVATLSDIDATLSLGIQDDGTYTYACNNTDASGFACTATRSNGLLSLEITNAPIKLNGTNPTCTPANSSASHWCP